MIREFLKSVKIWYLLRTYSGDCYTCSWLSLKGFDVADYRYFLADKFGADPVTFRHTSLEIFLIDKGILLGHVPLTQLRKGLLREYLMRSL